MKSTLPAERPDTGWNAAMHGRQGEYWSGREDSNLRPPAPKAGALARLRYAPNYLKYRRSEENVNNREAALRN